MENEADHEVNDEGDEASSSSSTTTDTDTSTPALAEQSRLMPPALIDDLALRGHCMTQVHPYHIHLGP